MVKRYEPIGPGYQEVSLGRLVEYSDYSTLEQKYADLLRRAKEYRAVAVYGDQCASSTDYFDKLLPEGKEK